MNEIGEKYLPIGTVVMLHEGTKRVMITGFCSAANNDPEKVWDYSGCPYPEGYVTSSQTCLFDHSQISQIYSMGLADDEEISFKKELNQLLSNINGELKAKNVDEIPVQKETEASSTSSAAPDLIEIETPAIRNDIVETL